MKKVAVTKILEIIKNCYNNNEINDIEYKNILSQILLYQDINTNYDLEIENQIDNNKLTITELIDLFTTLQLIDKSITYKNMELIAYQLWACNYNDNETNVLNKIHNLYL